jgi:hypothetical protein
LPKLDVEKGWARQPKGHLDTVHARWCPAVDVPKQASGTTNSKGVNLIV